MWYNTQAAFPAAEPRTPERRRKTLKMGETDMTHFQVPDKGSFRICQFTDIHLDTTKQLDE